ncbi:chitin synthase chs-2-like [Dreissena polymorpha]|uniref:chitin synthase chs-2-like n=1 Tax=Dreissena polymorpha TaxID=45954 RepID=UPI002264F688|nr:chitin synthase chs-2-like [Dreissena polymorpha]
MFTPDSVEALLDRMIRDDSLGAVCARTHPVGRGPLGGLLVWYQTFEYAIGHWFQKAAEHVIGTVLCSPGCFSIYRCDAIQDVLPAYATDVKHAYDFLTKDMGEDRWLCTLMVQKGWRIEYCAAAENRTFCPDRFDEFFKQRRRWIASTLANMMIFIGDWRTGGLKYAWDVRSLDSVITQRAVCFRCTILCLNTSSKKQLWVAKLSTVLYAVIMAVVVVGIAFDVVSDFGTDISPNKDVNATTTLNPAIISPNMRFSTTTIYLGCMVALFLVTGLLHLQECVYLFHGLWYLLFLPSAYLILTQYSICNITDITWGTREGEQQPQKSANPPWHKQFKLLLTRLFFCFFKEQENEESPDSASNNNT